ncbi:hypothetical protein BDN72DRAFT_892280 [Pluteus cervinus]|uniref:Uncharacterized protein n=1 Tax=Pluteus cervinus TaxID=181527 RepID=A0ACD3BBJ5_9AGAR|nr:hypothetical protein BDN72DRAFT_892280 [Pluteus cervinus]
MAASRDQLWAGGHDESVEVNQRALIDKVLARYSGEFTVFRELLQNSDDAQSKAVEIHFETQDYVDRRHGKHVQDVPEGSAVDLPDLKTTPVCQWTFKNNGILFRDEDWNRLKKIAEGNPDEEKIGAFGVGFYSLFSVTEEPFVKSGNNWMGFYWKDKKDQLFARRGTLPDDSTANGWTSFEMGLREPTPIPIPFDFTRFLASSITFMTHLSEISVYFNDKRLARLTKASGRPKELTIPRGLKSSSPRGVMTVRRISSTSLHIKAEIMRWVYKSGSEKPQLVAKTKPVKEGSFLFSLFTSFAGSSTPQRAPTPLPPQEPDVNLLTYADTSVALSVFSADIESRLEKKIAAELYRSTKKNPPTKLKYELIYTAKDEYDASVKEDESQPHSTGSVFQGLRADLEGVGSAKVFIGHSTAQTTGLGGHMATRFIPTVERESIDLMDRNVAIWNRELLYAGGFLARCAYELELSNIAEMWKGADVSGPSADKGNEEVKSWFQRRALHALKFFTFHPSTPSPEVSRLMGEAFFASGGRAFPLLSTAGVKDVSEVRMPDKTFATFLKHLPVLPEDVLSGAEPMITALRGSGQLRAITFDDVLNELQKQALTEEEIIACLRWWTDLSQQADPSQLLPIRSKLLAAAVMAIKDPQTHMESIIPLHTIRTFINVKRGYPDVVLNGPLPPTLLPVQISRNFTLESLSTAFPWSEFSLVDWITHLSGPLVLGKDTQHDITVSPVWSEKTLNVLSRFWPSLPTNSKTKIVAMLKDKKCIPTSDGMKIPEDSYFSNANIFHDLPVVTFPSGEAIKGNIEKLLEALDVRRHVDLQVVFNRMVKTNAWTIPDLAKYLASVRSDLSADEMTKLKMTAAFSTEIPEGVHDDKKPTRYRARQLYEPLEIHRQLGLPLIDWGKQVKWKSNSTEAKFLFELGLQRYPPLDVLIDLCAHEDTQIRETALKYFLDHAHTKYGDYEPAAYAAKYFIPIKTNGKPTFGTPLTVFANPEWAELGYQVVNPSLSPDAITKLKLQQHPPASILVLKLSESQPMDEKQAATWFGILAGRISGFSANQLIQMGQLRIVPVHDGAERRWLPPKQCYFGSGAKDKFHSKLFVFVDFGGPANSFLSACGTKREPSVDEVAQILMNDPIKFYKLAEGPDNYLNELRNLAVNRRLLSSTTFQLMKRTPILLGTCRKPLKTQEKKKKIEEYDEEDWDLQYDLRRPDLIVIADDTHAHRAFGDAIFTAPQEDILEGFYAELGSRRLSSLVREDYYTTAEIKGAKIASEIRHLILERLPLFLYEHTYTKTRLSLNWLSHESNFIVKTFGKLSVTKSLHHDGKTYSRTDDTSAVAKRVGNGPLQLWLAGNAQVDMVATSLNRFLFDAPKAHDALLFMTILSTDLRSLKRRGYNVDRILRQQQAERLAAEEAARAKFHNTTLVSDKSDAQSVVSTATAVSDRDRPSKPSLDGPTNTPPQVPDKALVPIANAGPPSSVRRSFQNLKHRFAPAPTNPGPSPLRGADAPPPKVHTSSQQGVTPLSNISANIDLAIQACQHESQGVLKNREEMIRVKESLDEGYCDVVGRAGNLITIGEMGSFKVYVSEEVPQRGDLMQTKRDALARFIHIAKGLSRVYNLSEANLHIFYDLTGPLIAFNRNGSLFMNLRFYEAWHDADVSRGDLKTATVSWYFTLAHEIAHNLVLAHNSEHEFWFSHISQKYIEGLVELVASA